MSQWKLVRLDFGSNPVHFGELGIGIEETSERVRSDTLFSSWVNAYVCLFGKDAVEELLETEFINFHSIRMSSTFIYRQKGDCLVYYLPRPLKFPINYPEDDFSFFKTYKKLKYLPLDVWRRWYQAEGFIEEGDRAELENPPKKELEDCTNKDESRGALEQAGAFYYRKTFKKNLLPKVAVDRITAATNFYHTGFVQFEQEPDKNQKSGLYFLLQLPDNNQDLENRLFAALHFLGEEGIGGERSSGAGRFRIEAWSELPLEWDKTVKFKEGTCYALMSLFWQKQISQEFLQDASYEIGDRGGWIGSPFTGLQRRRKKVRMFLEGSVFSSYPDGQLADVTPEGFDIHRIYRNGISLSLPIK